MMVADRVAEVGAGRVLRARDITPRRIRALVRAALEDPSLSRNAARIGDSLRAAGGSRAAVEQIVDFKRRSGITG